MPIQSRAEDTGIFTRETTRATGPDIGVALRLWAEKHNALWSNWLDWAAVVADAVLADPEAPARTRRDAHLVKGHCHALRHYLECGDTRQAAFQAFQLGQVVTRLGVRWAEPHAARGLKTVEAARQGHRMRYGTAEARARRDAYYRREVAVICERNETISVWGACTLVAERHGVSPKTVYRATRRK